MFSVEDKTMLFRTRVSIAISIIFLAFARSSPCKADVPGGGAGDNAYAILEDVYPHDGDLFQYDGYSFSVPVYTTDHRVSLVCGTAGVSSLSVLYLMELQVNGQIIDRDNAGPITVQTDANGVWRRLAKGRGYLDGYAYLGEGVHNVTGSAHITGNRLPNGPVRNAIKDISNTFTLDGLP